MLDKEFQFYLDNQEKLIEKFNGKYIVIIDEAVVGSYDDEKQAYFESMKSYEPGTFLIQYCEPGTDSYTQVFHSRVTFA